MKRHAAKGVHISRLPHKSMTKKGLASNTKVKAAPPDPNAQAKHQQLKGYEEALKQFQQQKWSRAKELFERVVDGPARDLAERAQVHLRVCTQRIAPTPVATPKSAEDHYTQGVALMNMGRWDEARDHLDRARKAAPKADHIVYAIAALDCLTGEADAAMENLKLAIQLRPENRYHARNDEDFSFLQEDPRFTELLYPERDGSAG
ncbi:MAG: tetratricopeptide repeat protein [Candidatus Acidiferrales bacterium]